MQRDTERLIGYDEFQSNMIKSTQQHNPIETRPYPPNTRNNMPIDNTQVLTPQLSGIIQRQVEFFFSDVNLLNNPVMRQLVECSNNLHGFGTRFCLTIDYDLLLLQFNGV